MDLASARDRIHQRAELNAFISLTDEMGEGPVVAVKDLVDVRGTPTTGGGIILPRTPAREDAPVVQRLRQRGCLVIGKTNLHEWAFGVTSTNPHYGAVLNPRDPLRVAGGSSGGSAVAVAAGMCDWAVGSDTGGSIRVPASLCGVVGFKPTLGTVDMGRVIPLSRSLDTLGPLAPDVASAALALQMMTGLEGLLPERPRARDQLRLAVPAGWVQGLDHDTGQVWAKISSGLPQVAFPDRRRLAAAGLTILLAEAAAYHRTWIEEYPDRYGADVLEHLRLGLEVTAVDYMAALEERQRLTREAAAAMSNWDALLVPATACVAPLLDQSDVREPLTRFTRPFNTSGQPVITLPAPTSGLPVGIQVVGHHAGEAGLVEAALALERSWQGG